MRQVWIADDDQSIRWVLEKALARVPIACRSFASGDEVLAALETTRPDVLVTDIRMPGCDGLDLLRRVKERHPELAVIVMTAFTDLDSTVAAFQHGAFDYLAKPFDIDAAVSLVRRALDEGGRHPRREPGGPVRDGREADGADGDRARAADAEKPGPGGSGASARGFGQVRGADAPAKRDGAVRAGRKGAPVMMQSSSVAMQDIFRAIGRLASSSASVLITGESGTGKELVARALHEHGARSDMPFIAVNAAAIPRDLLEAELFGHERGAFTGAVQMRRGRFEAADGGTLFLDEIGDMSLDLQARLLRVLAQGSFYRVGGSQSIDVDVRIVAATHQPLEKLVADRLFREDLYHRLNVIRLRLPALRQRRQDIPALARLFLENSARELGVAPRSLTAAALRALTEFDYPGNIRQLENICHWLTVMSAGRVVGVKDLPPEIFGAAAPDAAASGGRAKAEPAGQWRESLAADVRARLSGREPALMASLRREFEQTVLGMALRFSQGRRGEAAQRLGIGRNTFSRKYDALSSGADE